MTTAALQPIAPAEPDGAGAIQSIAEFEARLTHVAQLIADARDNYQRAAARDAARMIQQAAVILQHRAIQAQAAALVMDAERDINAATPAITPSEAGQMGGRGNIAETPNPGANPLPAHTLSRIRSAHTGLSDEEYQRLRQESIVAGEPLTRKTLNDAAQKARLAAAKPDATRLTALPYAGGKSPTSAQGTGVWVRSLLPYDDKQQAIYAEPFAGMASILLNRPRTHYEIINDINSRITNFFACLRRWPDEFARLLAATPWAEEDYHAARLSLDEGPPLERARKFVIVISQSIMKSDRIDAHWNLYHASWPALPRIHDIAARLQGVAICAGPASAVLERLARQERAVIYCDPPYIHDSDDIYLHHSLNAPELALLLRKQKGRVLLSENEGAWDDLLPGWQTASAAIPSA